MTRCPFPGHWIDSETGRCRTCEPDRPALVGLPQTGRDVFFPPDPPPIRIPTGILPADAKVRKDTPMARGLLDYFPRALMAVAQLSKIGNDQHNPGEEMHWSKDKSNDHADCIMRHLVDRGTIDTDKVRHSVKVAWRALALAELELEQAEGETK